MDAQEVWQLDVSGVPMRLAVLNSTASDFDGDDEDGGGWILYLPLTVRTKWWQWSFQLLIEARMASVSSVTEVKVPLVPLSVGAAENGGRGRDFEGPVAATRARRGAVTASGCVHALGVPAREEYQASAVVSPHIPSKGRGHNSARIPLASPRACNAVHFNPDEDDPVNRRDVTSYGELLGQPAQTGIAAVGQKRDRVPSGVTGEAAKRGAGIGRAASLARALAQRYHQRPARRWLSGSIGIWRARTALGTV